MSGRIAAVLSVLVVLGVAAVAAAVVLLPREPADPGRTGAARLSTAPAPTYPANPSPTGRTQSTQAGTTLEPCPRTDAQRVTVLTLNIHSGRTKAGRLELGRLASELKSWDADLVLLQEVDRGRDRTGGVDQARRLAGRLGYSHVYGPTRQFRPGSTGNAILTRWPMVDTRLRALPREVGTYRRGLARATVDVDGEHVDVFSTHLDHTSPGVRRAQARAVAASVRRSSRPVVLGGDLNAEPGTPAVRAVELVGLVDGWSVVGRDEGLTVPAASPRRRIDYVLANEDFVPVRSRVLVSSVSDHRAVMTTYDLLPRECG
jgi:endonuclease/exonuclease/phosphatase family metal-dependent hydrolase